MEKPNLVIINDEDGGVILSPAKSRKSVTDPPDPIAGDPTFDDLDSRFNMPVPSGMGDEDEEEPPAKGDASEDEEEDEDDLDELFPRDKKGKPKLKGAEEEDEEEEQDEEETEDLPDTEDEEEDTVRAGRGIKGRIARERRLREELKADNSDLRDRLAQLEETVNSRASEEKFAASKVALSGKIETKRAELLAAEESGDSAAKVRLIEELSDLKAELRTAEQQHETAVKAAEKKKTTASPIVARKVGQWKRRHPRFNRDAVFGNFAVGVDRQLASENRLDPESDEYYEELDRRIAERYPEEYKGQHQKKTKDRERPQHPSMGHRREGGDKRPPRKASGGEFEIGKDGRVKLTKEHVRIMRTFRLDPENAEDVRIFIRSNS